MPCRKPIQYCLVILEERAIVRFNLEDRYSAAEKCRVGHWIGFAEQDRRTLIGQTRIRRDPIVDTHLHRADNYCDVHVRSLLQ